MGSGSRGRLVRAPTQSRLVVEAKRSRTETTRTMSMSVVSIPDDAWPLIIAHLAAVEAAIVEQVCRALLGRHALVQGEWQAAALCFSVKASIASNSPILSIRPSDLGELKLAKGAWQVKSSER